MPHLGWRHIVYLNGNVDYYASTMDYTTISKTERRSGVSYASDEAFSVQVMVQIEVHYTYAPFFGSSLHSGILFKLDAFHIVRICAIHYQEH